LAVGTSRSTVAQHVFVVLAHGKSGVSTGFISALAASHPGERAKGVK
jgi:hypothetical protein